jgi:hypothetical protein
MAERRSFKASAPAPPGRLVDLGEHKLHVSCTGEGQPTVVVENGLGDFSFDWILEQEEASGFAPICTYDRAGYAWSDPGPMPRGRSGAPATNRGDHGSGAST